MKEVINAILTDPAARSSEQVETLLISQAVVAAPWAD